MKSKEYSNLRLALAKYMKLTWFLKGLGNFASKLVFKLLPPLANTLIKSFYPK